jgi:hypothetical protein
MEGLELMGIRSQAKEYLASYSHVNFRWKKFHYMTHYIKKMAYCYTKIVAPITRLKNGA